MKNQRLECAYRAYRYALYITNVILDLDREASKNDQKIFFMPQQSAHITINSVYCVKNAGRPDLQVGVK
jgi:hypothetical protein